MQRFTPRVALDRAAWQYSFCAYLAYREAPATPAQLRALAQAGQLTVSLRKTDIAFS